MIWLRRIRLFPERPVSTLRSRVLSLAVSTSIKQLQIERSWTSSSWDASRWWEMTLNSTSKNEESSTLTVSATSHQPRSWKRANQSYSKTSGTPSATSSSWDSTGTSSCLTAVSPVLSFRWLSTSHTPRTSTSASSWAFSSPTFSTNYSFGSVILSARDP